MSDDFEKDIKTELEPYKENKKVVEVKEEDKEIEINNTSLENKQLSDDYEYVRTNLYNVIEKGSDALEELIDFAKDSQSPRAFEVVAKLIDSISNSNEKIIDNYQKLKNIKKNNEKDNKDNKQNADTINNILFNGTTEQLFDVIEESSQKKKEK